MTMQRHESIRLCLLIFAAAASLSGATAQAVTPCPDLNTDTQLWPGVIQGCTSNSTTGPQCGPCHCALVNVITHALQHSGTIAPSQMYTAAAISTVATTMASCMRDFAIQLLENTDLNMTQLLSMEVCVPDARSVAQCVADPAPAAPNATQQASISSEDAGMGWADLVRDASCALAAGANTFGINATADSINCQLTPAASNWLNDFVTTTLTPSGPTQPLTISTSTTNTPVAWMADCWCDETYDPVCEPKTRIQYPNPCSAQCQYVASTVPCSSLEPLVKRATVPGSSSSVLVYDESLYKAAQQPVAFSGPPSPMEADDNTQLFYYYYEEDADDTQDASDMASGFVKAMMAANLAQKETAAAAAIAKVLPTAVQIGAAAAATTAVTAQDGATDSSTLPNMTAVQRVGGVLASLVNNTSRRDIDVIARVRGARRGDGEAAKYPTEERHSTVSLASADDAVLPSWLSTGSPDQAAGVYIRNPDRTSRILAALMTAARESSNQAEAAAVVNRLGTGLEGVLNATEAAAQARRASLTAMGTTGNSPLGGIFRSAAPLLNGTLGSGLNGTGLLGDAILNSTNLLNATIKAFDQVIGDADFTPGMILKGMGAAGANTAAEVRAGLNPDAVAPLQATASKLAVRGFDEIMSRLGDVAESVKGAPLSSSSSNLVAPRTSLRMQSSTVMNGTAAGNNSSSDNVTSSRAGTAATTAESKDRRKSGKKKGRRLFFT